MGFLIAMLALILCTESLRGAGITIVTHGFNGNVDGWVNAMGDAIPSYPGFPGTNYSIYTVAITDDGQGGLAASHILRDGVSPGQSDSGEIIISLDWSTLAGFGGASSTEVADAMATALLATNFIPALQGNALATLPLHLIGHSRGASVMAELARELGEHGVWVDQVTMLDPVPVGLFGDPPIQNYANVLFADNIWQDLGNGLTDPTGEFVPGAYNRQLTNLVGGYSLNHSDTHLWLHGTIQLETPASDTEALIGISERLSWWTEAEEEGTNAGFRLSLIGGGDRFSDAEPAGVGLGRIKDGYNQLWDFGVGLSTNRDPLPANDGTWPNLLQLNFMATNPVPVGSTIPLAAFYQTGAGARGTVEFRVFLDTDHNPYNSNEIQLLQTTLPRTDTSDVFIAQEEVTLNPETVAPGEYRLYGCIQDGPNMRYLFAPEELSLVASLAPPHLTALGFSNGMFHLVLHGQAGQELVLEASTNLSSWLPVSTNTLSGDSADLIDPDAASFPQRFYRARLIP